MTISVKRQSLSKMLRRLFAFLMLGGLVAVCYCEPANRRLPLRAASRSDGCDNGEGDVNTCATNETADVSSPNREDQTRINRKARQGFLNDDGDVGEVSGRKKGKGYGRILLYIIGAIKAALIYGLLHGVAALAGKAVLVAKIALAIALAAILKKNDHEKTSYEIVKHPHHSYAQTHSSSVDYDHRSDYGEEGYDHRKRRRILR